MSKQKINEAKQSIAGEMVEDAWRQIQSKINDIVDRTAEEIPHRVFQEVHTTGWLWWKHTYYTYYRYSKGSMLPVSQYQKKTIDELENK